MAVRAAPAAAQTAAAASRPLVIARDSLRVVYWPGDAALARRTLDDAFLPLVLPGLPDSAGRIVGTVILAPDPTAFDSLTFGAAPDWSSGIAVPGERLIVLPAFSSARTPGADPTEALRHELVHLALHQYLGRSIPRWFDEGYATWVSGGWDESSGWRIRLALLRGAAPPLDSLTLAWPVGEAPARLAYLLSASAVRFLASRGGPEAFPTFLAVWRQEGSFDSALRSVYQLTPTHFEQDWREMVKRRYGWLLALSQVGFFWALLTVAFLALGVLRRRRDRARMAQLEAEDRMISPPIALDHDPLDLRPAGDLDNTGDNDYDDDGFDDPGFDAWEIEPDLDDSDEADELDGSDGGVDDDRRRD